MAEVQQLMQCNAGDAGDVWKEVACGAGSGFIPQCCFVQMIDSSKTNSTGTAAPKQRHSSHATAKRVTGHLFVGQLLASGKRPYWLTNDCARYQT
jgi:hypothetical protein